jgi:hypothetical protein
MGKQENSYFTQALSRFARDVASDGAIRHLADLGYTAKQIQKNLDYPTDLEHIGKVMWEHFLAKGILSYEKPDGNDYVEEVRYVKENGSYGRTTFRRVVERVERPQQEYILVDFGKRMYQNREGFQKQLEGLEEEDRDYVMGLPWDLKPVYNVLDERMKRIARNLEI